MVKQIPGYYRWLRSDTCRGGLLIGEEASQEDYLADADHQQDEGLADGPERHAGVEVLGAAAALGFTQTEVRLVVDDRLQGLVDGHTS